MPSPMDATHQSDYPPKTPPPPKKPPSPPRPTPATKPKGTLARTGRRAVTMASRRGVNWTLESAPWSAAGARRRVVAQLHDWGYTSVDQAAADVVTLLVNTAVGDGGKRVSLHLADQNRQALMVVLSHQSGLAVADESVLPRIAELGATSCGTDTGEDGRRLWAVLDL
ncbi:hypothetical protein [Streptomyces sp. NPDC051662]|uniref:hypothetical protein n=1 Tax=Streptomyces sp. NPDC051662 TaxID=3154750 RepID=UPI00343C959D